MITKLTEDETNELKNFDSKRQDLIFQLGEIEFLIIDLEQKKLGLKNKILFLKEEEIMIGQKFQEKYGDGSIDLESGEITTID